MTREPSMANSLVDVYRLLVEWRGSEWPAQDEAILFEAAITAGTLEELLAVRPDLQRCFQRALDEALRQDRISLEDCVAFRALISPNGGNALERIGRRWRLDAWESANPVISDHDEFDYHVVRTGRDLLERRRRLAAEEAARGGLAVRIAREQEGISGLMAVHADLRAAVQGLTGELAEFPAPADWFRPSRCSAAWQRLGTIVEKIRESFPRPDARLPRYLNWGIWAAHQDWIPRFITAGLTRMIVHRMARRFIAGEDAQEAWTTLRAMERNKGRRAILDVLGNEDRTTQADADNYVASYEKLLAEFVANRDLIMATRAARADRTYSVKQFNDRHQVDVQLAVKFSQLAMVWDPARPSETAAAVKLEMRKILDRALAMEKEHGIRVGITIDPEQFRFRDLGYDIFMELMNEDRYRRMENVGVGIQGYFRDSLDVLQRFAAWSRERGGSVPIRLVKGAYHQPEVDEARANGSPCPVFAYADGRNAQWMTDTHYERMIDCLMANADAVRAQIASHNPRSLSYAIARARKLDVAMEIQMLFGLEPKEQAAVADMGVPTHLYMPVGNLSSGIHYLVRRLVETSTPTSCLVRLQQGEGDQVLTRHPASGHDIREYADQVSCQTHFQRAILFVAGGLEPAVGERDQECDFTEVCNVMGLFGYVPVYGARPDTLPIFAHRLSGEQIVVRRTRDGKLEGMNLFNGRRAVITKDLAATLREYLEAMTAQVEALGEMRAAPPPAAGRREPFRPVVIQGGRGGEADGKKLKAAGVSDTDSPGPTSVAWSEVLRVLRWLPASDPPTPEIPAAVTATYQPRPFSDLYTIDLASYGESVRGVVPGETVVPSGTAVPSGIVVDSGTTLENPSAGDAIDPPELAGGALPMPDGDAILAGDTSSFASGDATILSDAAATGADAAILASGEVFDDLTSPLIIVQAGLGAGWMH